MFNGNDECWEPCEELDDSKLSSSKGLAAGQTDDKVNVGSFEEHKRIDCPNEIEGRCTVPSGVPEEDEGKCEDDDNYKEAWPLLKNVMKLQEEPCENLTGDSLSSDKEHTEFQRDDKMKTTYSEAVRSGGHFMSFYNNEESEDVKDGDEMWDGGIVPSKLPAQEKFQHEDVDNNKETWPFLKTIMGLPQGSKRPLVFKTMGHGTGNGGRVGPQLPLRKRSRLELVKHRYDNGTGDEMEQYIKRNKWLQQMPKADQDPDKK